MKLEIMQTVEIPKNWHEAPERGAHPIIERQLKSNKPTPQHIKDLRSSLKFFTAKEVSDFLRGDSNTPSLWTVYGWIKTGKLSFQKMGGIRKVSSYQLADFLENQ